MTGTLQEAVRSVQRTIDRDRIVHDCGDRTDVLAQLSGADYISLTALLVGWASTLMMLDSEPNWGLLAMFGGFVLDKLDGWYARRTGTSSAFGRRLDSFIDVFVYLVPGAVLFHVAVSPGDIPTLVVGFLILAFGGLRLIRHNDEGFGTDDGASFYHGTTVVHTNVVVVANYFLVTVVAPWSGWIAAVLVALSCPLMTSDYKAYKTDVSHALAGVFVATATALALALELGWP